MVVDCTSGRILLAVLFMRMTLCCYHAIVRESNVLLTFAWIMERSGIYVLTLVKLSVSLLVVIIVKPLI